MPDSTKGKVFLIGAGPGHAELITLRGVTCLKQSDVVLYDYLVNPDILRHIPETTEAICLGRHGRSRIWPQEKISQTIVDEANKGRIVARLKSGDPIVFARAAEELDALLANNIDFEIVPGITAALAAGSYAGIPITHRDHASAVALITGQEKPGKDEPALDYEALARFPGTLVVYMGVTTALHWSTELIRYGMPPETPVALVRRCSWPNQQTIHCRLDNVADQVTPYHKFPPPVIAIVGGVTKLADSLSWFQRRPLFGQRVLITRPIDQSYDLAELINEQGAEPIIRPVIEISEPDDWRPVDDIIDKIGSFDWLVFSSANGVQRFLGRLFQLGHDARSLASAKLAAIGPRTAEALSGFGLRCDVQPDEYRAESLAEALKSKATGKRFLLLRASRGREVLAESLSSSGGIVSQVVVYRSADVTAPDTEVLNDFAAGRIDWVTVTSSAIARSLHRLYGPQLVHAKLASISPITSETLRELGHEPTVEATEYTTEGVIKKMVEYCKRPTDGN
jgi:uroporphyrinogen III methyltransferase/synthase